MFCLLVIGRYLMMPHASEEKLFEYLLFEVCLKRKLFWGVIFLNEDLNKEFIENDEFLRIPTIVKTFLIVKTYFWGE